MWYRNLPISAPPQSKRILVSDGVVQVIAQKVDDVNWIFDSEAHKDMRIDWWKELGELPEKILTAETDLV